MYDQANEEFLIEDETMDTNERNNLFKDLTNKLFMKLNPLDRRIIKKRFGIEYPFEMSIQEIAENEGISTNKVKASINNTMKIISNNINAQDKETLFELLNLKH